MRFKRRICPNVSLMGFFILCGILISHGALVPSAHGALVEEDPHAAKENTRPSETVQRVQRALNKLGLYHGPEDGRGECRNHGGGQNLSTLSWANTEWADK